MPYATLLTLTTFRRRELTTVPVGNYPKKERPPTAVVLRYTGSGALRYFINSDDFQASRAYHGPCRLPRTAGLRCTRRARSVRTKGSIHKNKQLPTLTHQHHSARRRAPTSDDDTVRSSTRPWLKSANRELSRTWSMGVPPVANMQLKSPHGGAGVGREFSTCHHHASMATAGGPHHRSP